ncbi:hypothetical protein SKAU_G00272700 [Synaphobranchus kaupii]|uniref:Uncharacterized protein n=1 Tax=Synaphobranchus kaupii TaxID=118154 RepID=A0A9Q1F0N9_SYNKA|nr:hypothetical protein SKAU_G00272700 [Synaphobranchus kaupii]
MGMRDEEERPLCEEKPKWRTDKNMFEVIAREERRIQCKYNWKAGFLRTVTDRFTCDRRCACVDGGRSENTRRRKSRQGADQTNRRSAPWMTASPGPGEALRHCAALHTQGSPSKCSGGGRETRALTPPQPSHNVRREINDEENRHGGFKCDPQLASPDGSLPLLSGWRSPALSGARRELSSHRQMPMCYKT